MPLHSFLPRVLAAIVLLSATFAVAEEAIPLSQVGAKATANYQGEALGIIPSATGATLRCGFQKLQGRATEQGLWLVSTEPGGSEEFRILANAVGRGDLKPLPESGRVTASDKLVQLVRPGLVEEYSVTADGVRQDFIVLLRPDGAGQLRLALEADGARAQEAEFGATLVLNGSGREIAYSRLHVTDAYGRELLAKIEVRGEKKLEVTVDDTGAAYPLRVDPTFSDADWVGLNTDRLGVNGSAYAVDGDAAGNVYVGGSFTKAGTVDAKNIARWDGTQWWPMGAGLEQSVRAIAIMNGEILAAGATPTVMRWDGTAWQPLGSGVTGVRALAVKGTDLYAAGAFVTADGATVNRIARWNGAAWSALGSGVNDVVYTLAVNDAGVQVGGEFTNAGGVPAAYVAQWNGSTWAPLGGGVGAIVRSLVWHQGSLWAGGDVSLGLDWGSYVARWNGTEWVDYPTWEWTNPVLCLASNGTHLYACENSDPWGSFPRIYRLEAATEEWSVIGSARAVPYTRISSMACLNGELCIAGEFMEVTNASGVFRRQSARGIARWTGGGWRAFTKNLDEAVNAIVVQQETIWLGGNFKTIAGHEVNHVARWNGSEWLGIGTGTNGEVTSLVVEGGNVYVAGAFSQAGGLPVANVAKWNGTAWGALGSGLPSPVQHMAVKEGHVYVSGYFWSPPVAVNDVAHWQEGQDWQALSSINGNVYALAIFNGDLVAGGRFNGCVARLNGTSWQVIGGGCSNGIVYSLLPHQGSLYVGGTFTQTGSVAARSIARWDGSEWSALGAGIQSGVFVMAANGASIYAVGGLVSDLRPPVYQWNGGAWSSLGSGLNYNPYYLLPLKPPVGALAVSPSGQLLVGGFFFDAGTTWSPFLAQANVPGSTLNAQESWRQTHFGSYVDTGNAADAADFDHDGVANLAEYAFALSPTQSSPVGLPQPQVSGSNYVVSFTHPAGMTGVTYGAEWSTTLAANSWQPVTDTGVSPQHVFSVPIGTNTQIFIRLKVTAP